MTIIDSQVHAYEANTAKRPWHSVPNWPDHVTGDEMVAAMDKVGVDGAIFISAFGLYRYDASYATEVQRAHPDRFAIVKPVDPDDPAVADVVADWKKTPGTVGIRIMLPKEAPREPNDPGLDLGRKNWLFAGSDSGGERAAAAHSLIETAKLNGLDSEDYLRQVLERIADRPIKRVHELLPWNMTSIRFRLDQRDAA